ncbi:MAG: transcription antitermination factor NusB [Planctomycetota bacterium]|jgi:transcription antitermination factor NusB
MRKRTRARELALQVLYQIDLRGDELVEELEEILLASEKPEDVARFARELVLGTVEHRPDYDRRISDVAEHWDISRMAVIDRNILRLAVHEMIERSDIPPKVTINEAIELGKKYSTENSGAFINGILDRIRRSLDGSDEGRS